jgi:hypothetical protein
MPRVRFEPTIPVFERAKTVRALDRGATVIGSGLKKHCLPNESCSLATGSLCRCVETVQLPIPLN